MSWHPNSAVETTKVCVQQATGASGADTATLPYAPAEGRELCSEKEIHRGGCDLQTGPLGLQEALGGIWHRQGRRHNLGELVRKSCSLCFRAAVGKSPPLGRVPA